jgi:hypothetical protein
VARDFGVFREPGSLHMDRHDVWTLRGFQGVGPLSDDGFFFVYQPLVGDGSVLALMMGQDGGNREWGRAGLMLLERAALRVRAAQLFVPSGHGVTFAVRRSAAERFAVEFGDARFGPRRFPIWLRLQREGDQIVPFASVDGFGWAQLRSPVTLRRLPRELLAGLSVASAFGGPVSGIFAKPSVSPGLLSPLVHPLVGSRKVVLSWPPVPGAIGYLVRRTAPGALGFTADMLTPAPIRETTLVDLDVENDVPQRYLISAVFPQVGQIAEGWATAVTVAPIGVPGGLMGCSLSAEAPQLTERVSVDFTTGVAGISGAGSAIGGREDHGFFLFRSLRGDGQITVRVLDYPTRSGGEGTVGVMIREGIEGQSRMAFLTGSRTSGLVLHVRDQPGEPVAPGLNLGLIPAEFNPPVYLRLVRRGNTVSPYFSFDGETFSLADRPRTFNPPLPPELYFGYAIASQDANALAVGSFSDLTIVP